MIYADRCCTSSFDIEAALPPIEPNQARMSIGLHATMPLDLAAWFVWNPLGKQQWTGIRAALESTFRLQLEDAAKKLRASDPSVQP